ncbi:MAG: AAA family ATPase, partial [Ignavibacteriae bacterium]|nr:AAA family ATPase [Ignavibacteriota bacterium]
MKINYFAVDNFRGLSGGLKNNQIIFKDTNTIFIFGQNNTGKSTFLQAYMFFFEDTTPSKEDFYRQDTNNTITFEIEVTVDEYDLKRIDIAAPKQKDTFRKYLKNDSTLRIKKEHKNKDSENFTLNPQTNEWEKISYGSIGLHNVFQSCMPKPIFIKAMPTEEDAKKTLNEILKLLAEGTLKEKELEELKIAREKIKELQDKMYKPETMLKYEESVNTYFNQLFPLTNIKIKDKKDRLVWSENKLGKDFDIEFNNTTKDGKIDEKIPTSYNSVGHGIIRTAIFTLLLMKDIAEEFERLPGRKDYIVLFEEPELFLYPKIIQELRSLIYKVSEEDLPYQLLCASHSPQMIDISKPKSSIIRLEKTELGTFTHQINDAFLKDAKEIKTDSELRQEMYEVLRF